MCGEADRWISMRVDGERMPPEMSCRLDLHLRDCPSCRRLFAEEVHRSSLLGMILHGEGKEEDRLAGAIIRAAGVLPRRWSRIHPFPFLWKAASIAAVLLVGIALRFSLRGPSSEPAAAGPERFLPSVLEQDLWRPDGVDYRGGEPLERGVRTQKWIYRFPGREPSDPRLYLEGERVDTLYQPVTWIYH